MSAEQKERLTIRPSARLLLTIGEDLIQDQNAAVVELVKNAYDADSPEVTVTLRRDANLGEKALKIIISDHGCGMSRDEVIHKWLVPATSSKVEDRVSPNGRKMQGSKGIGRYAASILGEDLLLKTVHEGELTKVHTVWSRFREKEYLDEVEVRVETQPAAPSETSGTVLEINAKNGLDHWSTEKVAKLQDELRKLISQKEVSEHDEDFEIFLETQGLNDDSDLDGKEKLEPYPLRDFFDYLIEGTVSADGHYNLHFLSRKNGHDLDEIITDRLDCGETGCGALHFDIRVFDRDRESLEYTIKRGLKHKQGSYFGIAETKTLLNSQNGIGVYRNGFRIRPLGDPGYDWLELDSRRVQNPTMRIGSNQVIGFVDIEDEEKSGLMEKSARDGLKNNDAYKALLEVSKEILGKLEAKRYNIRRELSEVKKESELQGKLDGLYGNKKLKDVLTKGLTKKGTDPQIVAFIQGEIDKDDKEKSIIKAEVEERISRYQSQAAMGKIVDYIMHEGRSPLGIIRNARQRMNIYVERFNEDSSDTEAWQAVPPEGKKIADNADKFSQLFRKLNPLSGRKRGAKKLLSIKKIIENVLEFYKHKAETQKLYILTDLPEEVEYLCHEEDLVTIMVNLIDNSIYWLENAKGEGTGELHLTLSKIGEVGIRLDVRDNGPGIDEEDLQHGSIFDPGFTRKPDGTGLGLTIAAEAAQRNDLHLYALSSEQGAHFVLSTENENEEDTDSDS